MRTVTIFNRVRRQFDRQCQQDERASILEDLARDYSVDGLDEITREAQTGLMCFVLFMNGVVLKPHEKLFFKLRGFIFSKSKATQ